MIKQKTVKDLFYAISNAAFERGMSVILGYSEDKGTSEALNGKLLNSKKDIGCITLRCFRQDENESEVDKDS